jgi:hypothetical protein
MTFLDVGTRETLVGRYLAQANLRLKLRLPNLGGNIFSSHEWANRLGALQPHLKESWSGKPEATTRNFGRKRLQSNS